MAGCRGVSSAFKRRRKRIGSSRSWAIKSKQPLRTSVTPTAPVPNNKTKLDITEETSVQDTKQLSSTLSIGGLFFAVGSIMHKCRNTIKNACSGFLNVFLFWRDYAERVESLHQKVEDLQMEIAQLHSTLKLSREAKTGGNYEMPDAVYCSVPPPPPVSLPPPPPPPPPPLPSTFAAPKVALIPRKTVQSPSLKKKQDGPVAVTLRDLQTVRLRKVTVTNKTISPDKRRTPLVTLADLQKVRLRRSHSDLAVKFRSSLGRTPTKSSMNLRVQLRKVHMSRSPGGTPLCNKENEVMDSSHDISMIKALENQHLNGITNRLSPLKSI